MSGFMPHTIARGEARGGAGDAPTVAIDGRRHLWGWTAIVCAHADPHDPMLGQQRYSTAGEPRNVPLREHCRRVNPQHFCKVRCEVECCLDTVDTQHLWLG
jgi:hypothetical protein